MDVLHDRVAGLDAHKKMVVGGPVLAADPADRKKKALIAVAHSIVVAIWHMHTSQHDYQDLGTDCRDKRSNPRDETERLKRRLEALGHKVTLEPAA